MKRLKLKPEQIIVPGEYKLGNESILKIYFRIFDSGCGDCLPPIVVMNKNVRIPFYKLESSFENYIRYNNYLREFLNENSNVEYFLLDGNHKSVAATLSHTPISVLELQEDLDIENCKRLVRRGELFNWTIPGNSLDGIAEELGDYLYHSGHCEKEFQTVSDRVQKLTSNGDLPKYMKERYLRKD